MRRLAGQAARHTGRVLHALVQLAFALVLTSVGLLAALTWRLSQGPLELPWLASQLEQAANLDQTNSHLTLGSAALTWEGFTEGVDRPLDIRVTDVVVTDAHGNRLAAVPRAEVSLSTSRLLLGQIVPRAIEVDGARLRVQRAADGDVTLDLGSLLESTELPQQAEAATAASGQDGVPGSLLREFLAPAVGDHAGAHTSRWSQLHRARIRDATVSVTDQQFGVTWALRGLDVDLRREAAGGVAGRADADLRLGTQTAHLAVTAALDKATERTSVTATLGQISPSTLAREVHAAEALAPLDVPVALTAAVQLAPDLAPVHFSAHAEVGAGTLRVRDQQTVVLGAKLDADGTPEHVALHLPRLELSPQQGGKHTVLQASADLTRAASGDMAATAAIDLDEVAFADLPALWPAGVGGAGARPWIAQNITDGIARNGHVDIGLRIPADVSDVDVTRVEGGIDGQGLTVHWLRPVPPIEGGAARLSFAGTDALVITVTDGHQGGLHIDGGHALFSGLNEKDQFLDIDADIAGPVPDLLTLLRNPRVKLLDRSPLPVADAAGQIAGKVTVAHLPLRDQVNMDDVNIRSSAKLTGLRLSGIVAGRDLDHGNLALDVTPDGLHASGSASIAGVPAQLQLDLDFHAGAPTEVLQTVKLTGTAQAAQLQALGVDSQGLLAGSVGFDATYTSRRDKHAEAVVAADLGPATLTLSQLGFTKPAGAKTSLTATAQMQNDQITAVAPIRLDGDGMQLEASATFVGGQPDVVTLQHLALGSGTDLHGEVRLPHRAGDPWRVGVRGASLDASSEFKRQPAPEPAPPAPAEPPPGPPYIVDVQLDRVVIGKGGALAGVAAHVENDGRIMQHASVTGRTTSAGGAGRGGGTPFTFTIEPKSGVRHLAMSTADAGALLLAFDIDDKVQGGRLSVIGSYDDSRPDHRLAGTAVIEDFRIRGAPMLAKLLQAMTLYGLMDVARGPGLGFTRLDAPFHYGDNVLELTDARAFSASLGMTAKGTVDLARHAADLQGTIVPAYFFNSLLGNIPLIGKLFSPERGGGLFAATYTVRGPLADPNVSVNPLAALTPGILRNLFGLLPGSSNATQAAPAQRPTATIR